MKHIGSYAIQKLGQGKEEMTNQTHSRRNVTIDNHRTSLCLETEMWDAIGEICGREGLTVHQLCSLIDERRRGSSRTSSVRAFIVNYYRDAATDAGHAIAGHGGHRGPSVDARRVDPGMYIDARRRLLSAPYFERRDKGDRRQAMQRAFVPDRRQQGERRQAM